MTIATAQMDVATLSNTVLFVLKESQMVRQ